MFQKKICIQYIDEGLMKANTQCTTRGAGDKRGGRGKEKNCVEQRHEEICGRERDGVGYTG